MQKKIFYSGFLLFLIASSGADAQILVSRMGPVQFFNSLDSTKSATLTKISNQCFCLMQLLDTSHSKQLKLDLAQNITTNDSVFYLLDFNNLQGAYKDSTSETPGIHIKARDSALRSEIILRLTDYGIRHYAELQQHKKSGKIYDKEFVETILKQKASLSFKNAVGKCK